MLSELRRNTHLSSIHFDSQVQNHHSWHDIWASSLNLKESRGFTTEKGRVVKTRMPVFCMNEFQSI